MCVCVCVCPMIRAVNDPYEYVCPAVSSLKVTGLLESKHLCSHSVVKLHEAIPMFIIIDYVWKMSVKKPCKYGEYGSFEQLLFLF